MVSGVFILAASLVHQEDTIIQPILDQMDSVTLVDRMTSSDVSVLSKDKKIILTYDSNGKSVSTTKVPPDMVPMYFDRENRLVCQYNSTIDQEPPSNIKIFVEPGYNHCVYADRVNFSQGTATLNSAYTWSFGNSSQSCLIAINKASRKIFSLYPGRFGYPYKLATATNSGRWIEEDLKMYSEIRGLSPYNIGFWISDTEVAAICKSQDPRLSTVKKKLKASSPLDGVFNTAYLVIINPESGNVKYHVKLEYLAKSVDFDALPNSGKMTLSGDGRFLYILFDKQLFKFKTDELKSTG